MLSKILGIITLGAIVLLLNSDSYAQEAFEDWSYSVPGYSGCSAYIDAYAVVSWNGAGWNMDACANFEANTNGNPTDITMSGSYYLNVKAGAQGSVKTLSFSCTSSNTRAFDYLLYMDWAPDYKYARAWSQCNFTVYLNGEVLESTGGSAYARVDQ